MSRQYIDKSLNCESYFFLVFFLFLVTCYHISGLRDFLFFFLWSEPVNPPQFGQKNSEKKNKNKNNAGRLDWIRFAFFGFLKSFFIWFLKGTMDLEKPVW